MQKPLFAFFGTPRFAVCVLDALEARGLLPALIVTAPDKPQGRGLVELPSPVNVWGQARGIDTITPVDLKTIPEELLNTDWDVFAVAAYAKLIPKHILDLPRRGCLNVHPSLLPKFRGPSPARSAILADERETGVSIMLMDEKMDHGPVLAQARIVLAPEDWPPRGSLFEDLLATEGGNLLAETIGPWAAGEITPEPQEESQATYTKKFTTEDARIDLHGDARTQLLKIKTFDTNPRAYFVNERGKRVIVTDAALRDGTLHLLRIIPEGKKEMTYEEYLRGQG